MSRVTDGRRPTSGLSAVLAAVAAAGRRLPIASTRLTPPPPPPPRNDESPKRLSPPASRPVPASGGTPAAAVTHKVPRDFLLVLLCLTLFLGVADLLSPAGAGAQSPGPCQTGWVAPTPTVIAVTSVPITVSSTEDDYFVLYVKHDRGSGTVVNVPVSVTRGESGTTTLSESLGSLGADKYRVEKYLVANPADIDGDCVDDITELDNFGYHNPMNDAFSVAAEDGSIGIKDRAAFENLSYQGHSTFLDVALNGLEYVKFTILDINSSSPQLWFQDTDSDELHWEQPWFRQATSIEFISCCWRGYAAGVLVYHPNVVAPDGSLGVYRWQFSRKGFDFREVSMVHETLAAAMPFLNDNLAYYPFATTVAETKYKLQKSQFDASRVNILLTSDILPDVEYVPYNEAEGYGLLGVFEPGESPGPRDVAILTVLPNDLPRAAGVITTVPQTPLSHVNLRAIQNGTPNAFIRDALTDETVTDLVGSYVYYRATANGYTLRAATKTEVDTHHAASRPKQTQTLQRDFTKTTITPLSSVSFADWTAFGVKAANVAELSGLTSLAAGVAPDGYAVPFYFYDEFMKLATVSEETILGKKKAPADEKITLPSGTTLASAVTQMLVHSKFQTDDDIQEEMLDDLRKAIKNATSPTWIITALTTMHSSFPTGTSLRYRSSTNNEDLSDFNGAGLYDSKTQDPDETVTDGIDKSIKAVWANLWNHRAFQERDFHRVDHTTVAMGVLVHPNYSDEKVNGVAVSYDPITGLDGYYYVNTQIGEDLVTNPNANSLPEELLLDSTGAATVLARSNLAPENNLFMTDAQMIQLRNSLKAIHDHFKTLYNPGAGEDFAMEIEFKITAQNKLAIKQARPWVFSQPLVLTPEISIVSNGDITEGTDATFTLTASPKPVTNLDVTVEVTQIGDFVTTGSQTVTITSSGTATLTVPAADDSTVENDGSVTATIGSGTGYTISTTNGAATVAIEADESLSPCTTKLTSDGVTQGEWTNSCKSFAPGRDLAQFYTFEVTQNSEVTIDLTSSHDTYLYLRQGKSTLTGNSLYHNDDVGGGNYNSRIKRTLKPGWYTIEATTFHANRTGPFQLEIKGLPAQASKPEVSIAGGTDVTEGGDATFTITATPTPSADLDVTVEVSQSGDYASTGLQTVTIPTTGSQTLTVTTTDDASDEANGSVTATISTGTGYTVSSSASAATVAVSDDDASNLPEISIAAGADIVEGGGAKFTITATPPPSAQLTVNYTVSQSGDFGVSVTTGSVNIYSGGSSAITITTTNDDTSEADGSVSVTLSTSQNYTVSTSAGSATVAVSDDDGVQLPPQSIVDSCVSDSLLTTVRRYYDANKDRAPSYGRNWKRVLITFRDVQDAQLTPFTAAEALAGEQVWFGWRPIREALECIEAAIAPPPPTEPEISIAAGNDVTEGTDATFTVTATPAPSADLDVAVGVSQSGDYVTTGSRTVTITTSGSATFTVATTNDTTDEPDGSVTATISSGTGYTVSSNAGAATVAVSDDDAPTLPEISITAGSGVTEGTAASFTLTASPTPASNLDVTVAVSQSGDYVTTGSRTVTIPSSGSKTFTVTTTDDSDDESDGSVTATISSAAGYTVSSGAGAATVAVSDNDAATLPEISITAGSGVTEGTAASFTLTASPTPAADLDITVAVSQSGDYVTTGSRTVTIPTSGSKIFTVTTTDDSDDEPDGSVTATISNGTSYTVSSSSSTATVAITDNDTCAPTLPNDAVTIAEITGWRDALEPTRAAAGVKRFNRVLATLGVDTGETPMTVQQAQAVSNWLKNTRWDRIARTLAAMEQSQCDARPTEPVITITAGSDITEGTDATFTVTASPTPTTALTVNLTISQSGNFGATIGADTVTIPTTGSATYTVGTTNDSTDEPDGSVTATLSTGTGYTISGTNNAATVAVLDDDDPPPVTPTISIAAGSGVTEGSDATFTVTASPAPATALTVNLTVSQSGSFGAITGTDTVIIPTTGSATFTVSTTNDSTDEPDGSVTATLSTGTGYTVSGSNNAATVAVADDDDPPATPTISIAAGSSITEGTDATFTVTATPAPTTALTVNLTVSQSGNFGAATGTDTVIIPTTGSATFTVSTTNDSTDEPDGSVTATLSTGTGYTVSGSNNAATVAVSDDDDPPPAPPTISIAAGSGVTEGSDATFTVTANPAPATALTVNLTVSQSGSFGATTGADTVTIPTTGSATFTVSTTNDNTDELDGSVTATLSTGTGYTVSGSSNAATVAVSDNDDPQPVNLPTVSISDAQEYEDYVLMEFYLQLSYASSVPVTVTIEFEEGTATYGGDFLGIDTTQTIAPGQTRKALYVPLRADGWPEPNETFAIKLTSASGATIADDTGNGTILNDD